MHILVGAELKEGCPQLLQAINGQAADALLGIVG